MAGPWSAGCCPLRTPLAQGRPEWLNCGRGAYAGCTVRGRHKSASPRLTGAQGRLEWRAWHLSLAEHGVSAPAISTTLHKAGREVIASYAGNDAAAEAFSAETGIATLKFDAGDFAQCEKAVAHIIAAHGPIEVLVNNAGITRDGTMLKMTRDMWDAVIDTNLGSCFNLCKLTFEGMRTKKFGRVVNVGSINGQAGQYGQVNYAAAKSGIHGFTKALAQEGARFGITVNAIAPGYVDTDMVRAVPEDVLQKIIARVPMGRLGRADDIARGVAFLTADDADFITGATLSINGGQTHVLIAGRAGAGRRFAP